MSVADWRRLLAQGRPWNDKLCHDVLKTIGSYCVVPWNRIQPSDRLDHELRLPMKSLHDVAMNECLNEIEYRLEALVNIESYPQVDMDWQACSIADLLQHVQRLWRERREGGCGSSP